MGFFLHQPVSYTYSYLVDLVWVCLGSPFFYFERTYRCEFNCANLEEKI